MSLFVSHPIVPRLHNKWEGSVQLNFFDRNSVLLLLIVTVVFNATLALDSKYQKNKHDFDEKRSKLEKSPSEKVSFLSVARWCHCASAHSHIVTYCRSLCLSLGAPYGAMSNGCLVSIITFSWQLLGKGMHWSQTPRG